MKVFFIPFNHEYIKQLKLHIEQIGVQVVLLKPFHYSSLSNLVKIIMFSTRGFKIIHVHWLYIFPFRFIMKGFTALCMALGIKIIWEMHNILPHGYNARDRVSSRWFYERVNGIIYHSSSDIQKTKEMLGTDMNKPYIVIPHGNFNESYPNIITKKAARDRLSILSHERVILCFGYIRRNRGYEYLIEAIRDLQQTKVIIAGKILDRDIYHSLKELEKNIPHLLLHGKWIPDEELQLYFNACDIVVLPYTDITTSGVIPLAYAFSRPVITSNIGGVKDVVNSDTGILVPPKDVAALRTAIESIFTKDLRSMGDRANAFANKELSWEVNAIKLKGFYNAINAPIQ